MQNLSIFDINISSKLTGIFEQLQSTLRKFDFSDIKEKELYSKVQSINPKQDIVLEDIEWLYEDYEKLSERRQRTVSQLLSRPRCKRD